MNRKGFASTVGESEKLDGKIVRMLKGALTENITDYTLDINYGQNGFEVDDDDFVLVEHVTDGLSVISLDDFQDSSMKGSMENLTSPGNRLPAVAIPNYLQAPQGTYFQGSLFLF